MHQLTYYHLILRYPAIRVYANACFLRNKQDALFDFLIALETDEKVLYA